ncbi:ATP-binding protein [Nonomuraea sp. NPDC046570]|uniref:ATP-binding protein n=1 Tax=Nonomuraea sp. NPDC046570 TaxID=3155255 RepID=UPI00340E9756
MAGVPGLVTLPGTARAVGVARHWGALVLEAAGCGCVDEALIVVSELVGNAVRHTRSGGPGGKITMLIVESGGDMVRIEVVDDGAVSVPAPREPDSSELSGRGLWLVDELSAEWGVRVVAGDRRAVWALMPISERQPAHAE